MRRSSGLQVSMIEIYEMFLKVEQVAVFAPDDDAGRTINNYWEREEYAIVRPLFKVSRCQTQLLHGAHR